MSVLAGRPGLGKTTVAVELAARATRGDLDGDLDGPVSVLYVTAEDAASVLVARLIAAGGDRSRFLILEKSLTFPDDAGRLTTEAEDAGAKLIVVDPYSAFSSGDSHRDSDARQAMAPLHAALAELGIAGLLVMHLNKSNAADLSLALSGSVAHLAAPRSALLWGRDPSDEDGPFRVLAHGKSNLGVEQPSQLWRMDTELIRADSGEAMEVGRAVYAGESDVTSTQLLRGADEQAPALGEAKAFLVNHLAGGPVRSREVGEAATAQDIAERTLKRAKADLIAEGVLAKPYRDADGWYLALNGAEPEGI
jgi:hypothetical protein